MISVQSSPAFTSKKLEPVAKLTRELERKNATLDKIRSQMAANDADIVVLQGQAGRTMDGTVEFIEDEICHLEGRSIRLSERYEMVAAKIAGIKAKIAELTGNKQ